MVKKIVDTHSTSLTQPTQIFTFAHSIVKHIGRRVASGDRKITDCIVFSVIFGRYSVFSVFKIPKLVSVSVFKNIGYRSVYRLTDPPLVCLRAVR